MNIVFVILGLGNPGLEYKSTRHNLGFMVVDALEKKHKIKISNTLRYCVYGDGEINKTPVRIAKPMTYMNESGVAAKVILSTLDLSPDRLIVVHDEIDLVLGKLKIKHKGGDAGQRGVRSIIHRLDDDRFSRVRVGVGKPLNNLDMVDYLLSPFDKNELPDVEAMIERGVEAIELTLEELNRKINNSEEEEEC